MRYDPNRHRRRSIRLADYDYSAPGSYFLTICTEGRRCFLAEVVGDEVVLSLYGDIVRDEWCRSASVRAELTLDVFVVMPNHLHRIVTIRDIGARDDANVGAHGNAPNLRTLSQRRPRSIATFVGSFKGAATRRINRERQSPGAPVWQRNYYERVIRDEAELERIRHYIIDNPRRWADDEYHPHP